MASLGGRISSTTPQHPYIPTIDIPESNSTGEPWFLRTLFSAIFSYFWFINCACVSVYTSCSRGPRGTKLNRDGRQVWFRKVGRQRCRDSSRSSFFLQQRGEVWCMACLVVIRKELAPGLVPSAVCTVLAWQCLLSILFQICSSRDPILNSSNSHKRRVDHSH